MIDNWGRHWWRRIDLRYVAIVLAVVLAAGLWRWLSSDEPDSPPFAGEDVAQATDRRPHPPLRRARFERLFEPGLRVRVAGHPAVLEIRDAGTLDLPSGRLVACDPFVQATNPEYEKPFQVTVPPGRYPVSISIVGPTGDAELPSGGRVAAVRLTVRPEPVVRWELALREGTTRPSCGPTPSTGSVSTPPPVPISARPRWRPLGRVGTPDGPLATGMDADKSRMAWDIRDPESNANVIAFRSGFGDGVYPTWVGWTANDQPAVFVSDLHVVDFPDAGK